MRFSLRSFALDPKLLAIGLAAGSIVGAQIGARFLVQIDERLLKVVFGAFLVGVAVLMGVRG